jgi:hypothetical protein
VPEDRPPFRFIGGGVEASLALGWYALGLVGALLAVFVSRTFYVVIIVGVATDWLLLRHRVARRLSLPPDRRRMLWLWCSWPGVYHAVRYLVGKE